MLYGWFLTTNYGLLTFEFELLNIIVVRCSFQTLTDEQREAAIKNEYNFDCPDAFDTECIIYTLKRLKEGKSVEIPIYNFSTHRVEKQKVT